MGASCKDAGECESKNDEFEWNDLFHAYSPLITFILNTSILHHLPFVVLGGNNLDKKKAGGFPAAFAS